MEAQDIDQKVAFVIPSCDRYADLWQPLFQALSLFWPDNQFRKYLIANHLSPQFEGVEVVQIGDDVSWSDNLIVALQKITEDYVLLNIEDLIICDRVDHDRLRAIIGKFISGNGNYLRLNPTPKGIDVGGALDIVPVGDVYRASTVFSIWRKDILMTILRRGESAWAFEICGTRRTDSYGEWFAAKVCLLKYVNLVVKGKVDPRALAALDRCGIIYGAQRPALSRWEVLALVAREKRSAAFALLPRKLKGAIRAFFSPV